MWQHSISRIHMTTACKHLDPESTGHPLEDYFMGFAEFFTLFLQKQESSYDVPSQFEFLKYHPLNKWKRKLKCNLLAFKPSGGLKMKISEAFVEAASEEEIFLKL